MPHALLGVLSGIIGFSALIPYARSILKGETKPNRAGWLIWAVVATIILFSYHFSGASTTIWLVLGYAIFPIVVFILSIKYGVGGFTVLDTACIAGAIIGVALWKLTNNPVLALYISTLVDFLGFVPTVKKAWLAPETENTFAWLLGGVATALNVLALTTWQFKIAFYPVFLFVCNTSVAILVTGRLQAVFRRS